MKKLIAPLIPTLLILVSATAFADNPLANDMQQIGALFKTITTSAKDSSQNTQSAANATQLVHLFTAAQALTPDSISQLPSNQQLAALSDYKTLIQQEIDDATNLQKAFQNGDNNGALSILSSMNTTKSEGHSKYAN